MRSLCGVQVGSTWRVRGLALVLVPRLASGLEVFEVAHGIPVWVLLGQRLVCSSCLWCLGLLIPERVEKGAKEQDCFFVPSESVQHMGSEQ